MKILLVSATQKESEGILKTINIPECLEENFFRGFAGNTLVDLQVTGIGAVATVTGLSRRLKASKYDLVINIGICGSFREELTIGSTVTIENEKWGDLGAEDHDEFLDLFELNLLKKGTKPFTGNEMLNPGNKYSGFFSHLKKVNGLTVNKVHGNKDSIAKITGKYSPDVESMEGAAVFDFCLREGINFQCLRSISNFVEPRNSQNWEIERALANLSREVNHILSEIR